MERLLRSKSSVKRVKFEATLDPLELIHSDVHELLFQHFKPEDSFRASLVSPSWSERTEKSLKCWEKLKLVISNDKIQKLNRPIIEILKSSRKYQKLSLNFLYDFSGLTSILQGRKWTSMEIQGIDCEFVQLKQIMKIVEPTVQTLHILCSSIRPSPSNSAGTSTSESEEESTKLKYPKLKNLLLICGPSMSLKDVAGDCESLEKLTIDLDVYDPEGNDDSFLSSFNKVLENNPKLEKLSFRALNIYGRKNEESRLIPFPILSTLNHQLTLKSLTFDLGKLGKNWLDGEDRLLDFLKIQANNLEELKLNPCTSLETIKTILKMPKLTKVKLKLPDEIFADWDNVHFNENSTIKDFGLEFGYWLYNSLEVLDKLFQPIPNCQQMKMECLNSTFLRSLAQHCPRIKELKIEYLYVQHIDELADLPAIEAFECRTVIKGLLLRQIRAKPDEARTRLEKLILQQASDSDFDSDEDENLDFDEA